MHEPLLHYILKCPATASLRPDHMITPPLDEPEAAQVASDLIRAAHFEVLANLVAAAPPPR